MSWAPLSSQECGAQTSHVLAIGFNQGVVEFAHTVVKGADLAGFLLFLITQPGSPMHPGP